MIKKWLSSYNIKYPRSIVYMLQASEYKIGAYVDWLKKIKSFKKVEVRKHLVFTKKATLLFVISWLIVCCLVISIFYFFYSSQYLLFILSIILSPYILAYGITIPLVLVKIFIQSPVEHKILRKAKAKLSTHKSIKIGVAGSFGKTTMREILKTVLAEGKIVAAPPENHNTLLGISSFIKTLKGNEEILIFELGEYYKGDITEMCELVNPEIGIITGINEAHLEKFKSLDTTISTIFELSDWLGDKPIYVNGENKLAKQNALENHLLYTRNGIAEWEVIKSKTGLNGTSFVLSNNENQFEFKSKLLGLHQIGPLVTVIHLAIHLGIPMEKIQQGIENTKPFDHRLEPKIDTSGVTIIDDSYNGNPDGVKVVIDFLTSLKEHRRFYVTPGLVEMGHKTEEIHEEIGKQLAHSGIEKVILIKNSVTPYIEKGLLNSAYPGEIIWFGNGLQAFAALPHLTVQGDVVLLQNDWPDQYY